jgi:hypothetical protein
VLFLALPRSGPSDPGQLGRGQTGQGQTGQGQTGLGQPDSVVSMMPVEVAEEPTPEKTFVPDSSPLVQSQIPSVELPVADGSKLPVPPKTVAGAKYILVAEIEIDPQAEQNAMLSQLLDKYEIIFSSDAPLSKVDFDTLVASNVIKNPAADPALKTDAATTCYLVKSNPKRLDALLTDVATQYVDFPSYRLNLSADPKVYAMMDHLADLKDSPNLAKRLVEVAEHDKQFGECDVNFYPNAKVNGRICTCVQVSHPVPRRNFRFHLARVFIDDELTIPIRYEAYDWPQEAGGQPVLLEEYTYMNVKTNNGFTDADFDPKNTAYKFGAK